MKHKTQYILRKQSKKTENTATLFPFLAVLLCTMGALVMLLVLVARNVQEGNAQEIESAPSDSLSREKAEEILLQTNEGIEEVKWFRENYELSKKEAAEKLADSKTQLSVLENEIQKIQDEIERLIHLGQELGKTTQVKDGESAVLKQLLGQRKETLERERQELAELQKKMTEAAKSYSIIPYQGKSGTFRRPIYIECRDNKVIIQPEGVELTEADFQLAGRPDNPFDAVMRTIRQYYLETEQIERGSEPYPLLVVRPSGADAYGGVCQSIGNWVQDYGYELVNEDWKVEYPAPSIELKERIERQLEISRNRLMGYLAALQAAEAAGEIKRQQRQYRVNPQGRVQALNEDAPTLSRKRFGQPGNADGSENIRTVPRGNTTPNNTARTVPDRNINLSTEESAAHSAPMSSGTTLLPQPPVPTVEPTTVLPADSYGNNRPFDKNTTAEEEYTLKKIATPANQIDAQRRTEQEAPQHSANNRSDNAGKNTDAKPSNSGAQTVIPNVSVSPVISEDGQSAGIAAAWTSGLNKSNNNWALKEVRPFYAAVSRTVKIQCGADKFVLLPQPGLQNGQIIPINGSTAESVDQLVYAVWDFMESWGIAGEKMYWKPVLQINVLPGGEQRFKELQRFLNNSGLAIEEKK